MQPSRFSIVLIALLSAALGLTATSSTAIGYPAGAAVSLGSNPVRSGAGELYTRTFDASTGTILSSSADQPLVITDVMIGFFQKHNHCRGAGIARIKGSDGVIYASIPVYSSTLGSATSQPSQISTQSGFHVPEGIDVYLEWEWGWKECGDSYYTLAYNLSGYLASP